MTKEEEKAYNNLKNFPDWVFGDVKDKQNEISSFFDEYGFIGEDLYYKNFIQTYGGYSFFGYHDLFSIYGFDDEVTLHLIKGEGELIDKHGFLTIADYSLVNDEITLSIGYAYDVTSKYKGIFRKIFINGQEKEYELYCNNFLEFIQKISDEDFKSTVQELLS